MTQHGRDDTQPACQRSRCQACAPRVADVTDTLMAGHHQPLRVWRRGLSCMGRNLSNHHMGQALDLNKDDAPQMTRP
jgi:hypothetical protein